MTDITQAQAQTILAATFASAREKGLQPMSVVVLDARGSLAAGGSEDGVSLMRWKLALGKAHGALALGISSRKAGAMAMERPHFVAALHGIFPDGLVPTAGGVLLRDAARRVIGAVGASGDASDADEAAALAGAAAAGVAADAS